MTICPLIKCYSGTILNRLETTNDLTRGTVYTLYDQTMMATDRGYFNKSQEDVKTLNLISTRNATFIHQHDIIINTMTHECAIVSQQHDGYLLPYNYMIVEFDTTQIYPPYFVYWFNEASESLIQLKQLSQGGSLVKKLTHQHIQNLQIDLPNMDKQIKIGNLMYKRTRLKYLKIKREWLMDIYLSTQLLEEDTPCQ